MDRRSRWRSRGKSYRRFNGATSFQKWIDGFYIGSGRIVDVRFNGATSFQKWIAGVDRRMSHRLYGFNGATSFQKWIEIYGFRGFRGFKRVSMGPLLFRNG